MIEPYVNKFEALLKYPFKSVTDIPCLPGEVMLSLHDYGSPMLIIGSISASGCALPNYNKHSLPPP